MLSLHFGQDKKSQYYLALDINFEMPIDKVNSHLMFLHKQNCFSAPPLRTLLLIQPLFLELNWVNTKLNWDRYQELIISVYSNQCPDYFNEVFCHVDDNGVAARSYNEKLKLPFRKSKLGMQSLSYAECSTWTTLRNTFLRNYL